MASSNLVLHRYVTALFGLAREAGITEQVEAELVDMDAMLAENDELRRQLENPRITRDRKKAVLTQLLGERATDLLRRTVMLMTDKGRAGLLSDFADAYNAVAMAASGRVEAKVESATPLGEASRAQLKEQLQRITGKEVSLAESVNEDLLGGLRVTIGSRMIDGSLRRRLELLQDKMLTAPLAPSA